MVCLKRHYYWKCSLIIENHEIMPQGGAVPHGVFGGWALRNLMKGRVTLVVIAVVVILALATIPLLLTASSPSNSSPGPTGEIYSHAPYSLHALRGNSSLIVLGDVANSVGTYSPATSSGAPSGLVYTVFQFNIVSYLDGTAPRIVYVVDTQLDGSPLIATGQRYVLFLGNHWGQCAPSPPSPPCALPPTPLGVTYGIVGFAQGKFLLRNNLVYGFKTLYPIQNRSFEVDANGTPLDQFTSQVQSA
jgi:hypothetical protein